MLHSNSSLRPTEAAFNFLYRVPGSASVILPIGPILPQDYDDTAVGVCER